MKTALILKNIFHENPGLVEKGLDQRGWIYDVIDLNGGEKIPDKISHYKILIVLGGPASANDQTPIICEELQLIKSWAEQGKPYLGICLGLQLLVKALGGLVLRCGEREIGFIRKDGKPHQIELTDAGIKSPLFAGMQKKLNVFQLHGEHVQITSTMKLLASSSICQEQVVECYPLGYGMQCHFELTESMLMEWAVEDIDLIPMDKEELLGQYRTIKKEYEKTGVGLVENFLKLCEAKGD
jgi:GMP synthase (glutamine-hydrolysing)